MDKPMITLIIPMYNESSIIADTAKTVSEYMQNNFDSYEILFSDDGSKDNSAQIVKDLQLPCVRVVGYEKNRGKGCAIRTGMLEAKGEIVMFTDADLAYGTDVIRRVYDTLNDADANMLIGSRNLSKDGYEGYTAMRKLMSKIYIKVLCIAGGFKLSDSQCGCKAYKGEAVKKIFERCMVDGFAFDFESILWAQKFGYKIVEMPVKIVNHRESKVNAIRDTFKMLGDLRKMKKRIKKESKELGL
ncbi:MAG: glycosyltransferase [Ruminococcaceae bacterium]|nr:glycosyltransferase [Oscillospiraceae bacterium]